MISALQHYIFCPRQFALIHVEKVWAENSWTAKGRIVHEKADSGKKERRKGIKTYRSLALFSEKYGIRGVADCVENQNGSYHPVEYKHGKAKDKLSDKVQLCAQVLCLEEMFDINIDSGSFYYASSKARVEVMIDGDLRSVCVDTIKKCQEILRHGRLPTPVRDRRCINCSLENVCIPEMKREANTPTCEISDPDMDPECS